MSRQGSTAEATEDSEVPEDWEACLEVPEAVVTEGSEAVTRPA